MVVEAEPSVVSVNKQKTMDNRYSTTQYAKCIVEECYAMTTWKCYDCHQPVCYNCSVQSLKDHDCQSNETENEEHMENTITLNNQRYVLESHYNKKKDQVKELKEEIKEYKNGVEQRKEILDKLRDDNLTLINKNYMLSKEAVEYREFFATFRDCLNHVESNK